MKITFTTRRDRVHTSYRAFSVSPSLDNTRTTRTVLLISVLTGVGGNARRETTARL